METMDWVSTQDAKRCYYLTTDDLRQVESVSVGGGIGCGRPTNLYEPDGLLRQSIRVHGEAGYQKKLAARLKREAKKRQREDDADAALEAMRAPKKKQQVVDLTDENDGAAAAAAAPLPAVNTVKLRRSLLKMSKKAFGFTMGGAPAQWRVQVPSITPEVFAALCGRPADRALATFVKRGAYHTHCVKPLELYGCDSDDLMRTFSNGATIMMYDTVELKYKPKDEELTVSGYGEIV